MGKVSHDSSTGSQLCLDLCLVLLSIASEYIVEYGDASVL